MMMMVVSTQLRAQFLGDETSICSLQACARRGNLSKNENERDSRKTRKKKHFLVSYRPLALLSTHHNQWCRSTNAARSATKLTVAYVWHWPHPSTMLLSRLASRAAASGTRALLARAAQRNAPRRLLSEKPAAEKAAAAPSEAKPGWWSSAEFWGGLGALAGWGMTGAAIYDAQFSSPKKSR